MRAGFGRKRIVVTQGDLIFSGLPSVSIIQNPDGLEWCYGG